MSLGGVFGGVTMIGDQSTTASRLAIIAACIAHLALTCRAVAQPVAPANPAPARGTPKVATPHPLAGPKLLIEGGYRLARGPFAVQTTNEHVLRDEEREKDLRIKVRMPQRKGDHPEMDGDVYPLILFSHGLGGSKDAFEELCDHLASHGYIVINPSHADSVQERRRQGETVTRENARDIRRVAGDAKWERVADLTLILDSLDAIEAVVPGLRTPDGRGRTDRERVGVAGHSAGAMTTQLISGVRTHDRENPQGVSRPDARVKASVVISGQGVNGFGVREDAWKAISIPQLIIAGSLDIASVGNETPATRRHPFEKARGQSAGGPPIYLLWIEGATHASYQGSVAVKLQRESPTTDVETIQRSVGSATLAFFDRYLRGEEPAGAYLASDIIKILSEDNAEIRRK